MIKVFIHVAKVIIVAVTALLFASCTGISGSGNVVTKERTPEGTFTKVEGSSGLEVVISQGDKATITVEADDNLQEHIKTEVSGNTLNIYTDEDIESSSVRKITVTLPVIEGISAAAGASVTGKTTFKGDTINLDSSSGSSLNVTVEAQKIVADASSGSHLAVTGVVGVLAADSSSGSTLDASGLTANSVTADASSGSNVTVNPTERLNAKASSGGSVKYIKTPGSLDKKEDSGGSVSQK